jgi:hypothetical protein
VAEGDQDPRPSTLTSPDPEEPAVPIPLEDADRAKRRKKNDRDDPRDRTATILVRQKMATEYSSERLGLPRFVALCSYLLCLLHWGWQIKSLDLDAFIMLYTAYNDVYPSFESAQMDENVLIIPSYHQWFLEQPRGVFDRRILTEHTLRQIGGENRYELFRAQLSLTAIMRRNAPWVSSGPAVGLMRRSIVDTASADSSIVTTGSRTLDGEPSRRMVDEG